MHFFLLNGLAAKLDKLEILVLLFVCAVQNMDHPGVNNAFVRQVTQTHGNQGAAPHVAVDHILERHHINVSFTALQMPQLDFLSQMPKQQFALFEHLCSDIILVTDMSQHSELMAEFFMKQPHLDLSRQEDRTLLMKMAAKSADVATSAMKAPIYKHSAELLFQELYAQGDRERAEGLPITPLCDRTTF